VAQSEPYVNSSGALSNGVRFCKRLLIFNGLAHFFAALQEAVFLPAIPSDARRLSAKRLRPRRLWRTPQFHRCDRRFRKTFNTSKKSRALRSSLDDHPSRVKMGFDFLNDRAEDAVDLSV
jgi:hypothetical protein